MLHLCVAVGLLLLPSLAAEVPLVERVAVIGASVSNGFGSRAPIAAILEEAVRGPHEEVLDASSASFYVNPRRAGRIQVAECIEHEPTLVSAVDFLFWYAHSLHARGADDELARQSAQLDVGLAELDKLDCPLVVGTIPDMWGTKSRFLMPAQVPSPEVLAKLNERITTWCDERPRVVMVPLAEWMEALRERGWRTTADETGEPRSFDIDQMMVEDGIHPTALGTLLLVDRMVDAIRGRFGERASTLDLDVRPHLTRLLAPAAASESTDG